MELLKPSVRSPDEPVIERSAKVATPDASVAALAAPPSAPPPLAMYAVTIVPTMATGFAPASVTDTLGCTRKGAPLGADVDGWVVMLRAAAGPVSRVIGPMTNGVKPGAVSVIVALPRGPMYAGRLNVAIPVASLRAVVTRGPPRPE